MELPKIKILDEKNKVLRKVSKDVTFPLDETDRKNIEDMLKYLKMSQIEEYSNKYDLRPGMGLSYVQIGVLKRIFVIVDEYEPGKFQNYIVINPKIKSQSEELIYVGEGEGCLSINRPVEGIVPRHARMTVEAQDMDGNKTSIRVREELAVAFQHEIDHLNGVLFIDHIDQGSLTKIKKIWGRYSMKNKLTKEDIQKRINILKVGIMSSDISQKRRKQLMERLDGLIFVANSSNDLNAIDKIVEKLEKSVRLAKAEFYRKNTYNKKATLEDVKKSR